MKRDIEEIKREAEELANWDRQLGGTLDDKTALAMFTTYHDLVEEVLHNSEVFFQAEYIAKYKALRGQFEDTNFRLVVDYSNNNTLIPYIIALEDAQFISPCFIEE